MDNNFIFTDKFYLSNSQRGFTIVFGKEKNDVIPEIIHPSAYGMSPYVAKELFAALYVAISEYESKSGPIKLNPDCITKVTKIIEQNKEPMGFSEK